MHKLAAEMVPLRARRSWTRYAVGALAPQASDYRNARATYDINLLSYHLVSPPSSYNFHLSPS
jgi:hypothetical protein